MKARYGRSILVGLIIGAAVLGGGAFVVTRVLRGGPAEGTFLERLGGAIRSIPDRFSGNLRTVRPDIPWVGGWETAEGEETVTGSQTELEVTNISGPVRVVGSDEDVVRVHYVKQARSKTDLEEFVIEVKTEGDEVQVRPIYTLGAAGRFGSVEFVISVPARVREVTVRNTSGDIVVEELRGPATRDLVTVSGAVRAAGEGDLKARSTSGSVEFTFRGDKLEVGTISGKISGRVEGAVRDGVDLGSVSGSVEVDVAGSLDADLELKSLSGSIRCDYPVTITDQGRGKLEGTAGNGGAEFKAHTTSGSIQIKKA